MWAIVIMFDERGKHVFLATQTGGCMCTRVYGMMINHETFIWIVVKLSVHWPNEVVMLNLNKSFDLLATDVHDTIYIQRHTHIHIDTYNM